MDRFDGLQTFVGTAQTGSFTAAGVELGLTSSAVGKSVSRLEARLGVKLLHRTTRRLTLTPDGEAYLETCLAVLDELEVAENELSGGRAEPAGRIRIDLPAAFGRRHVMPALIDLSVRYPRLDLSVTFTERTVDLVAEGIELAVRIGTLSDEGGLMARRLGAQRLVICASPEYITRHGAPTDAQELMARDCIVGWRRAPRPAWLLRDETRAMVPQEVHARHEFSDGDAMVQAVLAGAGLSQLPTWLIGEHLAAGTLVPVLERYEGGEMPIHAVWPQSRYLRRRVRVTIDALVAAATRAGSGFLA